MNKPKTVSINARLTQKEYEAIEQKAKDLGMSISALVRLLATAEIEIKIKGKREDEEK